MLSPSFPCSIIYRNTHEHKVCHPFQNYDPSLESRLFIACRNNDVATVQAEIESGIDINENQGCSALFLAMHCESIDVVKLLLKQPSIEKDSLCIPLFTPLAMACVMNKEVHCILELIQAGCNINISNERDQYPLWLLFHNKSMEWKKKKTVILELIKYGVDLDEPTILKKLIKCYDGSNKECLEILHLLLYYNIDVNYNGVEVLTYAIRYRRFDICDILWDYIADFTINSDELLFESIKEGYKFDELIEAGVDINIANFFERHTALIALLMSKDAKAVERLNSLWERFESRDKIVALVMNVNIAMGLHRFEKSYYEVIKKDCFIRFSHLFFNFIFESQYNLYDNIFNVALFFEALKNIELHNDENTQMFYLYLMCTSRINCHQLYVLYRQWPKEQFETFLKVNINIVYEKFGVYQNPLNRSRVGRYNHNEFDCILYTDFYPLDMKNDRLPSLVKFCRNKIRLHLQPHYATMIREDLVYFRYYNRVNQLDVPKRIKDILLLNVNL